MALGHLSVHFVDNLCVGACMGFWSARSCRPPAIVLACFRTFAGLVSQGEINHPDSVAVVVGLSVLERINCVAVSTHTFGAFLVCIQVGRFAVSTPRFPGNDSLVVVSLLFGVREIEHCLCEACGSLDLSVVCNCDPLAADLIAFPGIYSARSLWLCSPVVFPNPLPCTVA